MLIEVDDGLLFQLVECATDEQGNDVTSKAVNKALNDYIVSADAARVSIDRERLSAKIAQLVQKPEELDEAEEMRRGAMLADALNLKRDEDFPDRWLTDWGNKTNLGLYRIVRRLIVEGM
jgi:hypothetical protein